MPVRKSDAGGDQLFARACACGMPCFQGRPKQHETAKSAKNRVGSGWQAFAAERAARPANRTEC